jgi:hypothetical protein
MSETIIESVRLVLTILPYVGFCVSMGVALNPDSGSGRMTLSNVIGLVLAVICLLVAIADGVRT